MVTSIKESKIFLSFGGGWYGMREEFTDVRFELVELRAIAVAATVYSPSCSSVSHHRREHGNAGSLSEVFEKLEPFFKEFAVVSIYSAESDIANCSVTTVPILRRLKNVYMVKECARFGQNEL